MIVPDQAAVFRSTDVQKHALTLSWSPPVEANGVLTGCVLQYQLSMPMLMQPFCLTCSVLPCSFKITPLGGTAVPPTLDPKSDLVMVIIGTY